MLFRSVNSAMWRKLHGKILPSDRGKKEAYITSDWPANLNYASLRSPAREHSIIKRSDVNRTLILGKERYPMLPCGRQDNEEETRGGVSPIQPISQC